MAIQYNENIKLAAPASLDRRYLSDRTLLGSPLPYSATTEVLSTIILSERYTGLTVNVLGVEYWFKDGVSNSNLIEKKYDSIIPNSDFVTGATNIGYFSGYTGIQTLPITNLPNVNYNGNYNSIYNYFYRDTNGHIHIGIPSDGIAKRGYVKTALPVKSWLWNEYIGSSNQVGWILIDGNIADQLGTYQDGVIYYSGSSYTAHTWTTGIGYNNGSNLVISTVLGSLTTGSTYVNGAPIFAQKTGKILDFRTIQSKTIDLIKITNDEAFVYLSGSTGNQLITAENGLTKVGQIVKLGGTLTATTTITDSRVTPVGIEYGADYGGTYTIRSLVDKGYVDGKSSASGERIVKSISQTSHGFNKNDVIGWSGGTYNKAIANGTYDGEVVGIVTNCFNANCFELTQAGYVTGLTASLSTNMTYFLSDNTPGLLTTTEPSTHCYISKSVLIANSSTSGWVLPYAGYIISSGFTDGGALVKSVCLPSSPYTVTNTDFFVGVAGGSLVVLPTAPKVGMVVIVADINNSALSSPITVYGSIVGPQSSATINTDSGSMTFIWNGTKWSVIGFAPAAY
jgi:hypothetical protein